VQNEGLQNHLKRTLKGSDRFCESQTPPFFHGPSITTSPLEKINDLIKIEIPHSSNPRIILPKIEAIVTRSSKYIVQLEKSRLTLAHQDYGLE
jgi:hypothetical protein